MCLVKLLRSNENNRHIGKIGNISFQFPQNSLWEPGMATAQSRVRLRGKQPLPNGWAEAPASRPSSSAALPPGTRMPARRGPRTAPTAQQVAAGEWSPEEQAQIDRFSTAGGYQARERKRLVHNRSALANSWHVISPIEVGDDLITCQNCDFTTVVGQFTFWLKPGIQRECLGNTAPRHTLLELRKKNSIISKHNETCLAESKHEVLPLAVGSTRTECGRCHEWLTLSQHSFQDFRKERCLVLVSSDDVRNAISTSRAPRYKIMASQK